MRKWIVPRLAAFISFISVLLSQTVFYGHPSPEFSLGYAGVDTFTNASQSLVEQATYLLGQKPAFWGRYFNGLSYTQNPGEYIAAREGSLLGRNGIRVLPVARASKDVGGSYYRGKRDGREHAGDFVQSFKNLDGKYIVFLDVEYSSETPALSRAYYRGWSKAIASYCPNGQGCSSKVKLLPGVYLSGADSTTSDNLQAAIANGSQCGGLWIVSWGNHPASEWNPSSASPATSVDCPVLFWQHSGNHGGFNTNLSNPDRDALSYLALPES